MHVTSTIAEYTVFSCNNVFDKTYITTHNIQYIVYKAIFNNLHILHIWPVGARLEYFL